MVISRLCVWLRKNGRINEEGSYLGTFLLPSGGAQRPDREDEDCGSRTRQAVGRRAGGERRHFWQMALSLENAVCDSQIVTLISERDYHAGVQGHRTDNAPPDFL